MAVLTTVAVAATVNTLLTRLRLAIGDTQAQASGQKFSDTQLRMFLDDMLAQMWAELYEDAGPMLAETTLTYTANARSVAIAYPLNANTIYKVEDIDNVTSPRFIDYYGVIDMDRDDFESGWTLIGEAIALRPIPGAAKSLRISYLRNYVPISGSATPSTDQHNMPANHEEYLVIGAAIRAQEIDDEVPNSRLLRYTELKKNFQTYALRVRAPSYVRDTRLYG